MNKVILIGRAATAPEHMLVNGETPRCAFRLAVRRKFKNAKGEYDADFLTVVCWRGLADLVAKHLKKGSMCGLVGSITTRSYVDNSGANRYITEIEADEVEFLGGKPRAEEEPQQPSASYTPMQGDQQAANFTRVDDDELPF